VKVKWISMDLVKTVEGGKNEHHGHGKNDESKVAMELD